jgi:hypothetical protein
MAGISSTGQYVEYPFVLVEVAFADNEGGPLTVGFWLANLATPTSAETYPANTDGGGVGPTGTEDEYGLWGVIGDGAGASLYSAITTWAEGFDEWPDTYGSVTGVTFTEFTESSSNVTP